MGRTIDRKVDAFGERVRGRLEQCDSEDRQELLAEVSEYSSFAQKNEWPEKLEVARWLLTEAQKMGQYDFAAGCKMYRHDACKALFNAFKNEDYVEMAKGVHRVGLVLQREGIEVMRYNYYVLSYVAGAFWLGNANTSTRIGQAMGSCVEGWWDGCGSWVK